jgi:hypothetical protein
VNAAMEAVLDSGKVTADLRPSGRRDTSRVGAAVCETL